MNFTINTNYKIRELYDGYLETLSLDQLNKVPDNFRNNIFWNIKHAVVTQQILVYHMSEMPMNISEEEVNAYRKGSRVTHKIGKKDIALLRKQLFSLLDKTRADYKRGLFTRYNDYTTRTGSVLTNVKEALKFNNFHEGLHLGYIMAMKRSLGA